MQAWLFEPGQHEHKRVGWPTDPITGAALEPPVLVKIPYHPAPADPVVSRPRNSRGPFRARLNRTECSPRAMIVDRNRRNSNMSQDRTFLQPFPTAGISMNDSSCNVDKVLSPQLSPYTPSLDLYQQRLGPVSLSISDASELPDSSRMLHRTPELSSSSRNSSISAIPDIYLSPGNNNYGTSNFLPGSP